VHAIPRTKVLRMPESVDSPVTEATEQWVYVPVVGPTAAGNPVWVELGLGLGVTMTPLVSAFFNELGRRLGSSCGDWLKRGIKLRFPSSRLEIYSLPEKAQKMTTVEIDQALSDPAWLGLLDINWENDSRRGKRLRWDEEAQDWLPVDKDDC
jgi:hypothetical protein